ncbi:phosphate transport regulator related to PhoU [Brevibacillus sp. CF112]|uniref:DUF47 domain-containing protein n=1 Tax=Brevibacillus TaxID=55080 RepID=UPI000271AB20|nr:DUF47 family protein [Brevibacillus sp. CF112]EJL38924.1 phosphate transport regulator related to PhoU [Brevibacillus sp. CF112]
MLFTKSDALLDELYAIAKNVYDSAIYFNKYKIKSLDTLKRFSEEMKEYESKGDKLIHEIIVRINKTFISAIEREDVLNLAVKLDDVLDGLEGCAARLYMYDIMEPDETMVKFGQLIEDATQQILFAIELLQKQKLPGMKECAAVPVRKTKKPSFARELLPSVCLYAAIRSPPARVRGIWLLPACRKFPKPLRRPSCSSYSC